MKLFGSIKELVAAVFRKDSQEITLRPNQSTTYTSNRDIQLPPGDTAHVLSSASSTQTLTNKTIDGDDNTVQDLPVTAIKTVLGDADKVLLRDASGVPTSALIANVNVSASAAIAYSKLAIADGDLTIAKTNGLQTALDGKVDENAPITGATKTKITYDAKGLVTAGADIAASDLPTGIDAAKIADGSVSNTEFQKLGTAGNQGLGELVTTDGVQRLIVKDIDGETASDDSRITLPKETTAGLAALTRKEATLAYDTTLAKVVIDDGSGFAVVGGGGGSSESVHTVTNADYTILDNDGYTTILVSTGASNRTITLPTLSANQNRPIRIKKIDSGAGNVIIDGESAETIDGAASITLYTINQSAQIQGSSTEWKTLNKYNLSYENTGLTMANVLNLGTVSTTYQHFEAFQLPSGLWKVKLYLSLLGNSVSSTNIFEFSISTLTFKDGPEFNQPINVNLTQSGPGQSQAIQAFTIPNTGTVRIYTTGNVVPNLYRWIFSGEVILESKPSWA